MKFKALVSTADLPFEDWLEYRKQGLGGSDASVVCGVNRYKSPVELFMEKSGQLPYSEAGEAAYWGNVLESVVREEFTKRTEIKVTLVNEILQSVEYPFMLANVDGTCEHPNLGTCIFEAKTAGAFKFDEWENKIPDEYLLQLQHYLAVTGYAGAYIAVLIGGNTFKWRFIERDEELISMLVSLESDFWEHVQNGEPPPLDGTDATVKFLAERFPDSTPQSCIALPTTATELIKQYSEASAQEKAFKEQKQLAENLLKEMLGTAEVGDVGGHVVSWKSQTQERLDTKTFKAEHPRLFKKYATQSSFRRFSVKEIA
jgi:putative phage-type endonuclease